MVWALSRAVMREGGVEGVGGVVHEHVRQSELEVRACA